MKGLFFTVLLGGIFSASSQTLLKSVNEPTIGDLDKNYSLDTSAYTNGLPVSITGSNVTWDFTQLHAQFPLVTDTFISPLTAPGASNCPDATFTQYRAKDNVYSYFKSSATPDQTELLGAYNPTLVVTFTNSAIVAAYPVNFGYFLSDPVSGSATYKGQTGNANGSITISADGLGTVKFPGVNITNVLRLKSVEEVTVSTGIFPIGSLYQVLYNYYAPGRKFPILTIQQTHYQFLAGTPTITSLVAGPPQYFVIGAGVEELSLLGGKPLLYPNPFSEKPVITPQLSNTESEYTIYGMNGEMYLRTDSFNDAGIDKLLPGVYFLEVKNRSGIFRQKIIRE
jgi:hypothetical protein